jgi:multidrug resistance protein MdtO
MSGVSAAASALRPFGALLKEELARRPGRFGGSLRTAVCCCVVTAVVMVFDIPGGADSVFMVFLISSEDTVATVVSGLASLVAITAAIALALFVSTFDSGSAVVRLPTMALITLGATYSARAFTKLGPAAFMAGYLLIKVQAIVDQLPAMEDLVHGLLWLWVVGALPIAVVVLAQLATGERPGEKAHRSAVALLRALADSLRHPGTGDRQARHAAAAGLLRSARHAAMIDASVKRRLGGDLSMIETLETLLSMQEALPDETPFAARDRLADDCDACAEAFAARKPVAPRERPITGDRALTSAPVGARPVVVAMDAALARLREALARRSRDVAEPLAHAARPPLTDPGERRDNIRFAVKTTVAVMLAYFLYTGLDAPGISTVLTTCYFVALGSLGESIQKLTLRISGALLGGLAAGLCIAFVRPSMTDIGQLALLIGVATGLCAWVAASSVRLSYMGLQMAFAFLLGILQGHAPPSHFKIILDRVMGIILGNLMITVIFSSVWPTSARERAARSIDQALRALASLLGPTPAPVGARLAVFQAVDKARRFEGFATFELRMMESTQDQRPLAETSVDALERIAGRTLVAAELPGSPAVAETVRAEHERAARLLLDRVHNPELKAPIPPTTEVAGADGATSSDGAAAEASALLLAELEGGHGAAS